MNVPMQPKLFPPQAELLKHGYLQSEDNWLICAPTGAGKTRMAEWAVDRVVQSDYRAAYLAPLRAIVEERLADWTDRFPHWQLGLFTGRATKKAARAAPKDETVLLFTAEKLASYLNNWKRHLRWIADLDVVVIDEIHVLGDPNRGAPLEALIGRLQRINPFLRIIGLSGTLSNHQEIADWLRARTFVTDWRPIPVEHRIRRFKRPADKVEILLEEVGGTLAEDGRVLVFVNSRRRAEAIAAELRKQGIVVDFNHAGLSQKQRARSQDALKAGELQVMVATSTLEMGVNFPARKVIIHDAYTFDGERFGPLSIGRYRQFAGRAGRAGYDRQGESVLLLPVWHREGERYLTAEPEPARSALFSTDNLLREILVEIAGRLSISREHLEVNFASRTLWRAQGGRQSLGAYVSHLIQAELLRETEKAEHTYLSTTALGRIAAQMALSPYTIGLLVDVYRSVDAPTLFDILLTACLAREATPKLGFAFQEIDQMADVLLDTPSALLDRKADWFLAPGRGIQEKPLLSAVKCAVLLFQHTQGDSIEQLAADYDTYPADLRLLREHVGWVLDAAERVFGLLARPKTDDGEERPHDAAPSLQQANARSIKLMVQYGIPTDALGLTKVPGIGPKRAQALVVAGIRTPAELRDATPEALAEILRLKPGTVSGLQKDARDVDWTGDNSAQAQPPSSDRLPERSNKQRLRTGPWPEDIDPYRLRRALELNIDHASVEVLRISGGAEPHRIDVAEDGLRRRTYTCDCADFKKGTPNCKHVLRARLEHHDQTLLDLLRRWQDLKPQALRYSLGELWIRSGRTFDAFHGRDIDYQGSRFLKHTQTKRHNR